MLFFVSTGYATTTLTTQGKIVRVTYKEPIDEFKFLGDVAGSQGDFFTGAWTSNENLETGARNYLKNKAAKMSGNLVVLLTQRAGSRQTNVTLSSSLFRCP